MLESSPVLAEALAYHPMENCGDIDCSESALPYFHQLRLTDLEPGTFVPLPGNTIDRAGGGSFSTLDDGQKPLRFIVYGDSETEPESTGKHAVWPSAEAPPVCADIPSIKPRDMPRT